MRINTRIDRFSYLPFYAQVREALREAIEHGDASPNEQLPSEVKLCSLFDVSRTVVRQALVGLEREGLLVRRKGRGTFVAQPKIGESMFKEPTGFFQDMASKGKTVVSQVLKQSVMPCSPRIAEKLQIDEGAQVIQIDRIRFVNDEPIVFVSTWLPYALCPGVARVDLTHKSLYDYLESRCGIVVARGRRIIRAVIASEHEAHLLSVAPGSPLISLESIGYLEDGTPVEHYQALHRGDRALFEVDLVRKQENAPLSSGPGAGNGTFH